MQVKVLTNHKSLEYFMTTKKLTPRQARWAEFLSKFNFVVIYQTGKKNEKADALTRKLNKRPISNEDYEHKMQVLLPLERIEIQPIKVNKPRDEPPSNKPAEKSREAEEQRSLHAAKPHAEPQPNKESVEAKHEEPEEEVKKLRRLHTAKLHAGKPHAEHKESVETEGLNEELKGLPSLPN